MKLHEGIMAYSKLMEAIAAAVKAALAAGLDDCQIKSALEKAAELVDEADGE